MARRERSDASGRVGSSNRCSSMAKHLPIGRLITPEDPYIALTITTCREKTLNNMKNNHLNLGKLIAGPQITADYIITLAQRRPTLDSPGVHRVPTVHRMGKAGGGPEPILHCGALPHICQKIYSGEERCRSRLRMGVRHHSPAGKQTAPCMTPAIAGAPAGGRMGITGEVIAGVPAGTTTIRLSPSQRLSCCTTSKSSERSRRIFGEPARPSRPTAASPGSGRRPAPFDAAQPAARALWAMTDKDSPDRPDRADPRPGFPSPGFELALLDNP